MTLKNTTFKNTYIGKLKKNTISFKNIVKEAFFEPCVGSVSAHGC